MTGPEHSAAEQLQEHARALAAADESRAPGQAKKPLTRAPDVDPRGQTGEERRFS